MGERRFRLAAYAVCRVDDRLLLASYISARGDMRHWTLPGGGVEHGEDPCHCVVREVEEETGYQVEVEELLGVDSRVVEVDWDIGNVDVHSVGVFYRVRVTGGELRHEVGGSTDEAAWIPMPRVPELERAVIIDIGLKLADLRPPGGHVEPIPVTGRLRH